MLNFKKSSFAFKFTLFILSIIIITAGALSVVFFYNLYSISYTLARINVEKSIGNLRDNISSSLEKYADMLDNVGHGISVLYDQGPIPVEDLRSYFGRVTTNLPEVGLLYFANNIKWTLSGGYWVSSPEWTPAETWDQTGRPWFINAKAAGGAIAFSDPYLDAFTGDIIISISRTVFDGQRRDIGVVAADILVTKLNAEVTRTLIFQGQRLYLLNRAGLYITHADPNKVMKENFFRETNLEEYFNDVITSDTYHVQVGNIDFFAAEIPGADWFLVSITPRASIFAETNKLIFRMLILCILVFIVAVGVSGIFTYFMLTRPLGEMQQVAGSLAKMDFAIGFQKIRNDEIGETQRALIQIRDSLKKSIDEINGHLAKATEGSKQLNKVIVESSQSLGVITSNMEVTLSESDTQLESVAQTSDSITKIVKSIDHLEGAVVTQASHITKSASLIEDMVSNIGSIRSIVGEVSETTDVLSKSSASGHSMLIKLTEEVKQLHEQSAMLQAANKTIANIAAKTNLLSMNAAIEAAHAGETGRGFAVVADEVRKLADLAGKESKGISEEIKKMGEGIARITNVTEETVQSMNIIFNEIKAVDAAFIEVNSAVEKQASGGSNILSALKSIQEMTDNVRTGSEDIHEQSSSISNEMQKLQRISENVTKRVHEVNDASKQITSFLDSAKEMVSN
ncbi:MAG: methyl-accepting chemotaxis protein [Spirochaetaceae bacterium]|nr:methyl-accepting chemotaxis protein [Spirochaetaceae bacterium]